MFSRRRKRKDGGAALVEFALMMPLLLLLLFGIVEFGWVLSENLDVRQGAREGARLTAVNLPTGPKPSNGVLGAEICSRMDLVGGVATIEWKGDPEQIGGLGDTVMEPGDGVTVTVTAPLTTLTGLLDWAFPASSLVSSVEIRIEQPPDWIDGVHVC